MDDLDRRLVAALRADAREPAASLARRLGVTRGTVTQRIERLQNSGVILGFTARVRDETVGDVRAVSFIEIEGRATAQVIEGLRGLPQIVSLHTTNGAWDLVADIRATSLSEFDAVLGRIRSVDGVLNSETSLLLSSLLL
ncbi:AsnC family transcriptional regulator [Kineosporia sp. NBRC 101677]|uniref:Lrp/AsnC family transcriptional regulator n=1 Tax=Kineosporia sp. NBRC 101677 TaxID=3032197 RepID=UPI0024A3630B|nr:Lrp/AsnC family transcriptional regulator [Kineosporia sp. NBRC 101677]GLY16921.1 AsnC family transcriptional regulator [Kineosporia sp. NBRC 101677]